MVKCQSVATFAATLALMVIQSDTATVRNHSATNKMLRVRNENVRAPLTVGPILSLTKSPDRRLIFILGCLKPLAPGVGLTLCHLGKLTTCPFMSMGLWFQTEDALPIRTADC